MCDVFSLLLPSVSVSPSMGRSSLQTGLCLETMSSVPQHRLILIPLSSIPDPSALTGCCDSLRSRNYQLREPMLLFFIFSVRSRKLLPLPYRRKPHSFTLSAVCWTFSAGWLPRDEHNWRSSDGLMLLSYLFLLSRFLRLFSDQRWSNNWRERKAWRSWNTNEWSRSRETLRLYILHSVAAAMALVDDFFQVSCLHLMTSSYARRWSRCFSMFFSSVFLTRYSPCLAWLC